jgi:DNA-directed RNA polymerase subunit K/omega
MPKPKTLYSNNKNVDINNYILKESKITLKNNLQSGGAIKKRGKKGESDSEYESESEELDDEESEEEDQDDAEQEDVDVDVDEVEEDEAGEQSGEELEDEEDNKSTKSNVSEEFKDEEKKCYSKYALPDADDINYDELFADDDFKMKKNERLTKPVLFKYEKVRLLSSRAKQLAQGAKPMIKNIVGLSPKDIALLELKNKVIPLIIERPVPNSGVERWKLSELEIAEELYN